MIEGFNNELFKKCVDELRDEKGELLKQSTLMSRAKVGQRTITDLKNGRIANIATFLTNLDRICAAANKVSPGADWGVEKFYSRRPTPGALAFEWFAFPDDKEALWGAWCSAYDAIFSYQEDRDCVDSFREWAEQSAHAEANGSTAWPFRSVQGGAVVDQRFIGIFHATLAIQDATGLITYVGLRDAPGFDVTLFVQLKQAGAAECRKCAGQDLTYLFEIDQPPGDAWKAMLSHNVPELRRWCAAPKRQPLMAEAVRCVKRGRSLIRSDASTNLVRDAGGALFPYVQPDMRLKDAGHGRPMWLCVLPTRGGPAPLAQNVVSKIYDLMYGKLYVNVISKTNVYWQKLNELRTSRVELALHGAITPGCPEFDAIRLTFLGDDELRAFWASVNLRRH